MTKKIAVPVNSEGNLDSHFGHCKFFVLLSCDNKDVISEEYVTPPPHEPGVLPRWLAGKGVTDVIAGGMGNRAIQIFNQEGINVFVGAPILPAKALTFGMLNNTIVFNANYCDH
ncbi:MAG: ATPase [Prolixibacteraceae bacterium]|nr:ATPase [Prolixibacteraceae bacterium]MBN2774375.1 ATPase [Prolixibacteraceae bacterium]